MCVCEMLSAKKRHGEPDGGSQRDGEKEVLATTGLRCVRKQWSVLQFNITLCYQVHVVVADFLPSCRAWVLLRIRGRWGWGAA